MRHYLTAALRHFRVLLLATAVITTASVFAPNQPATYVVQAQEAGPVTVASTPRATHSLGSELVGETNAHIVTIDSPGGAPDYKYQFLQNGVRFLINRQDGASWQQLVSQIQTAPEYIRRQGVATNCVWNPYGLNVSTGGSNVLQGFDRQDQPDGSIKMVRTYATSEEGIAETMTETWTIPATTQALATNGPKAAYTMTKNRGIVPDGSCQEGTWRMRWAVSGIAQITADNTDMRDSANWPLRRKGYSNGEFTIDVNDFDNLQTTIQHTFSEIGTNNKAEILFYHTGTTGDRTIDPTVVSSNIASAWNHNKQRNVFYNGSDYFVLYDKGGTSIYARGASTIAGLASASEQTIINGLKDTTSSWDIYVVNDTKFDLIYQPQTDQATVQTCTISGTTIDCTTLSSSTVAHINFNLGGHTCIVRTPSADRIWVLASTNSGTLHAADQTGDSGSVSTWTSKTTTTANQNRCSMVPYGSTDGVLYLWQHDQGGTVNDRLAGSARFIDDTGAGGDIAAGSAAYTRALALGNLVRISDTDFRTVYIDANDDVIEAQFNGTSWNAALATVHAGTDKNPSLFYNRLDGDLYALYADSNDDIWYHSKPSGSSWGIQTNGDADEADANSLPVTQMHEPPTGSSRTNINIRFPWCYRNANSTNFDVVCEAVDISDTSPRFTLNDYRWYVDNDNENVADPWGIPDIAENTALTAVPASNDPPGQGQELRLRVNFTVNSFNLDATSQQFMLQYKAGTDESCTSGTWTDVGAGGGAEIWRFATSGVTDGTDLTVTKLAASDVLQEYVKANPSATNHNSATVGQDIEYDFHIEHNGAANANTYSFRVVQSDDTVFDAYNVCPTLTTEPSTSNLLRHGKFFADELKQGYFWAD